MPWIESHQQLENHPKLILLCAKTEWDIDQSIGKLHRLWWWVLDYAEDGDLSKYDPEQYLGNIRGKIPAQDLLKSLQEANFIDSDLKIHDWLDYAGRYLDAKYHTANPSKLRKIQKRYGVKNRLPKGSPKVTHLPTLPTLNNLTNLTLPMPIDSADQILKLLGVEITADSGKWLSDICEKFPGKDYLYECKKMISWWQENKKTIKRPKSAYMNWIERARGDCQQGPKPKKETRTNYDRLSRDV